MLSLHIQCPSYCHATYVEQIGLELKNRQRATALFYFSKDGKDVFVFKQLTQQQIMLGMTKAEKFVNSIAKRQYEREGRAGYMKYTNAITFSRRYHHRYIRCIVLVNK